LNLKKNIKIDFRGEKRRRRKSTFRFFFFQKSSKRAWGYLKKNLIYFLKKSINYPYIGLNFEFKKSYLLNY
jgi:hypothetical protein